MINNEYSIATDSLTLVVKESPWDTSVFGFPVATIEEIKVGNIELAEIQLQNFMAWVNRSEIKIISCRLSCQKLNESMLLESRNFKFIETVLHPVCENLFAFKDYEDCDLIISLAKNSDLDELRQIAENAFVNERFYVDTRVDQSYSRKRYSQWVMNAFNHPKQNLIKITSGNLIIGLFVYEILTDNTVYWHLTAINPKYHGKGYGRRVWLSMLAYHCKRNIRKILTTIAARNLPVLNLYSSLNFRFEMPENTFHWIESIDKDKR